MKRPSWLHPILLCAVAMVSTSAAASFSVVRIATGLEQPVYVTIAPGDDSRLFIVEANSGGSPTGPTIANIRILNLSGPNAGTVNAQPFLTINGIPQVEDQGLFCLAFHPNYQQNGFFYVTYAFGQGGGESRIERYHVSANPDLADATSATTILSFFKPFFNHNGDWLGFSPTDLAQGNYYLYHTTGDGGSNQDPMELAQDLSARNGKILRVDVGADGLADDFPGDADNNFAVPPGNPFVGQPGADPAIWAVGFRNPWRASFDRITGDLYVGNVGANQSDEVEFQPAASAGGENYGWSRFEGTFDGSHSLGGGNPPQPGDVFPMLECAHGGDLTSCAKRSITGGYVYRGPVQELNGQYVFADFLGDYDFGNQTGGAQIFSTRYDGSDPATFDGNNVVNGDVFNRTADFAPNAGTIRFISSFGEDAAGNLYIVDTGNLGTPDGQGLGEVFQVCGPCQLCPPLQTTVPGYCSLSFGFADSDTLDWTAEATAARYDVIRGSLDTLRSTGGDFTAATTECLEDGGTDTEASDTDDPPSGDAFFYLLRGVAANADAGSYESGGAGQDGFRDGEIYSSTLDCP